MEYIRKRSGRKVRNPRFKLWFHHQYPWESYSTSLNLSCAISTVKMLYQMTSCYSVFLLFHQLLVYFELRDLVSFVDIHIEEISSWSLFSLILLPTNGCLEPPTSTQPTFKIDPEWKVLSAPPGFETSLPYPPPPRLSWLWVTALSLGRQVLCFFSCGNSFYPFFDVNFILLNG